MASNGTLPTLPNPFTPLAFLPPSIAGQFQATIYVYVATLSAFSWDWLMSIPEEIRMCRQRKFTIAVVVYFLSRIGTLGYCVLTVVITTAPIPHCAPFTHALASCVVIAMPSSAALFFFRVKAVYYDNRFIKILFGSMWLAQFALTFLVPFSLKVGHIATTERCIVFNVARYVLSLGVSSCVFDTLVFIAVSVRIVSLSRADRTFTRRAGTFFRGHGLSELSRTLLQGGQLYYFVTIAFKITSTVFILAPLPTVLQTILSLPNITVESAMACRVFRQIRIGMITEVDFARVPVSPQSTRRSRWPTTVPATERSRGVRSFESSHRGPIQIEVTTTTHSRGLDLEGGPSVALDLMDERV